MNCIFKWLNEEMGILIKWVSLDGEITKFKVLMGKYLNHNVLMGVYINFSNI